MLLYPVSIYNVNEIAFETILIYYFLRTFLILFGLFVEKMNRNQFNRRGLCKVKTGS